MTSVAYLDDVLSKQRIELIDGKIVMISPRPRYEHITIVSNIISEFNIYLKGKSCQAFADGFDLYLDDKNHFIPDCMIVCNEDIIRFDGIHGAPDLVVEVLSASTAKNDRSKKKDAYEKAGVKEYWIVEPFYKTVEIYLNTNSGFVLDKKYQYYSDIEIEENSSLIDDDKYKMNIDTEIKVSVCDNLIVKLKDIFDRVDRFN